MSMFFFRVAFVIFCFAPLAQAGAATFSFEKGDDGFDVVIIKGQIEPGDDDHFKRIAVASNAGLVVLESPGGSLPPALEIGRTIQLKGFGTYVPDGSTCTSACALIWVAGSTRFLSPNSRVGFHASYRDNNGRLEEVGVANAMVGRYLTLLNLPERAIFFATSASPTSVTWVDTRQSNSGGISYEILRTEGRGVSSRSPAEGSVANSRENKVFWQSGSWQISRYDDNCMLISSFHRERGVENASMLVVILRYDGSDPSLGFFNEKFRSIDTGAVYDVTPVFALGDDIDVGWGERTFRGISTDLMNGLAVQLNWDDLKADLRRSDHLYFMVQGEVADSFPLAGSAVAITQLERCVATPSRLADPFAH